MNAHWKICLRDDADPVPDPEDEPLLTHLGNAEFALALDRLLASCHSLGVVEPRPLNDFANQWLGSLPTGETDDPVVRLQTFGVVAMRDVAKRLGRLETDSLGRIGDKRALLAQFLDELVLSNDPAATLCHFVRYRVPTDPRLACEEHFDAVRRAAIDSGIRKSASLPPGSWPRRRSTCGSASRAAICSSSWASEPRPTTRRQKTVGCSTPPARRWPG